MAEKRVFPFPYPTPYSIQEDFMNALYNVLDSRSLGVFESPTGTGKSVSIICSALQWLKDEQEKRKVEGRESQESQSKSEDPHWVVKQSVEMSTKRAVAREERTQERIQRLRNKQRSRMAKKEKKEKRKGKKTSSGSDLDSDFDDSDSDSDFLDDDDGFGEDAIDVKDLPTQIIYASRTHTQLTQFVNEIKQTSFSDNIRVVTLSSRQKLCINDGVRSLNSAAAINEKCLDLRNSSSSSSKTANKSKKRRLDRELEIEKEALSSSSKSSKSSGCPYYRADRIQKFSDECLAQIHDIEELVTHGNNVSVCPYYGVRRAIVDAELVCVPYQAILHKNTRESLGLVLGRSVVIFDEAHNVVDAVNAAHSAVISAQTLRRVRGQLNIYSETFKDRFKTENRERLLSCLSLLDALLRYMSVPVPVSVPSSTVATATTDINITVIGVNDFLNQAKVDHFNIFELLRYLRDERVANKTMGYATLVLQSEGSSKASVEVDVDMDMEAAMELEKELRSVDGSSDVAVPKQKVEVTATAPGLETPRSFVRDFESLLDVLKNPDSDLRVVVSKGQKDSWLKFLLVSPLLHFNEVVSEAKSVVLAGGTMQPYSDVMNQLYAKAPKERVSIFTCGHIVPDENLSVFLMGYAADGQQMTIKWGTRAETAVIDRLGRSLEGIVKEVPGGVVVFFQSYSYIDEVVKRWKETGCLAKLNHVKAVYSEERAGSRSEAGVEALLARYQASINGVGKGAVLLAVIGGKLSEGINFSDDLGRCVVVVGLPYPNFKDPVLQERLKHMSLKTVNAKTVVDSNKFWEHYHNMCMKPVNQSIGRVIRHAGDYACVVLCDSRWAADKADNVLTRRLPEWIRRRIMDHRVYGDVVSGVRGFFVGRNISPK